MPNELGLTELSIIVIVSLQLQNIYDLSNHIRVDFAAYWLEDNNNSALRRFFELVQDLYPVSSGN